MTLAAKLDEMRAGAAKRVPPEQRAVMAAATKALAESNIMGGVVRVGDRLPAFAMRNQRNEMIESGNLLDKGHLVLTVFRGVW